MAGEPTTATYIPQTEYRAYRDVIGFLDTPPVVAGSPLTINTRWPVVAQQLNTATVADYPVAYDSFRQFANQAFVVGTTTVADPVWHVIHGVPLYSGTPIVDVDINAGANANWGDTFYIGKGCFSPNIDPSKIQYNNAPGGGVVVCRYIFPRTSKATGAVAISQMTITRTGGPYSTAWSDFTFTVTWQDISTGSLTLGLAGTPRRRIETISCIGDGRFIALVTKNNPVIAGPGQFNSHTAFDFYKITGALYYKMDNSTSGSTTATWTLLSPAWSFPIGDNDYNNTGPVYAMEWMSYCFSAPYDGPALIHNAGATYDPTSGGKPSLGMTVTVFNGDSYGKAMYFVEKDGVCSDVKPLIPTYNAGQTDYVSGLGTTSFIPTGMVQVSMRRDAQWSGLYVSGEFTRTSEDGISTSISCYMIGNSLLTDSNSLGSGSTTGNFGWSFGAKNFFIDSSGARACLPLSANGKFSLEFDYEPTWANTSAPAWPTITDTNDLATTTNAYWNQRATLLAFANSGKVFKADLTNSRFHNPPFVSAHEIVDWEVQRQSSSGTALTMTVQRSALNDRAGKPAIMNFHITSSVVTTSSTTLTISTAIDTSSIFLPGTYFQVAVDGDFDYTSGHNPLYEIFQVASRSWSGGTLTITINRAQQGSPLAAYSGGYGVYIIPFYSRFDSGNSLDIRYWGTGEAQSNNSKLTSKIGGFLIEDIEYDSQSGVSGLVTVHGMDYASSLMANWSSPIDMFFDPKSIVPQSPSRLIDNVPSLKYLVQKTPAYPVDLDGLNGYESWDATQGYSHWGVNRPAIFYNAQTEVGGNPLNKHRIRFGSTVDNDIGIQAFGSILAGYDDGTMIGAFIGPPTKRAIWASSSDTRTTGNSGLDTGPKSLRQQDNSTNKNRVNILGSRMQDTGDYQGFTLAPGGRQLVGVNGAQTLPFANVTLDTTNSAMTDTVGTTFTINGNHASNYTAGDLIQLQDAGCGTTATTLDTGFEVMQVVTASYSAPNTTVTVVRSARGTTPTTHLTALVIKRIVSTDYKAKQLETIFGSSNDYWDGYQRIVGGGGYKVDADLTIAQDTDYDFAVKQFGRNILAYYKVSTYGAGALGGATNIYTLATHYLAEDNRDSWMRPGKKRYTGFAVSTDAWFKQNTDWPDSEVGIQTIKFNVGSQWAWDVGGAGHSYYLYNDRSPINYPTSGGGYTVSISDPTSGILGFPSTVTGYGAIFEMIGLLYTARWWDSDGRVARAINGDIDASNPVRAAGDPEMSKWTFGFASNVLFRTKSLSGAASTAAFYGIPFRASDASGGALAGNTGYMIIGDEVVRWRDEYAQRKNARLGESFSSLDTNGDYLIYIPVDIFAMKGYQAAMDQGGKRIGTANWRTTLNMWKGWNSGGTAGMGSRSLMEVLSPYGATGSINAFHINARADAGGGMDFLTVDESPTSLYSPSDICFVWPRAQLGTSKLPHSVGDFISSYPVANTQSGGFPADYGTTTVAASTALQIKDSIRVKRNASFQGPYRSVMDSAYQTTALAGARTIFNDSAAQLTTSYVDTQQSALTASGWSVLIQARPIVAGTYSAPGSASLISAILRFRSSAYYFSIAAQDWSAVTGTKALLMTLYWGDPATPKILEKVEVPLFGHPNGTNLTEPIRISLSGDTLSVDVLDEQIWSFDLSSYSDGNGSTYYSSAPGPVEIKTVDTQTDCWWWSPELGDEVEATVVDRGAEFGSALSFLMNGRWVRVNPSINGYLLASRFLSRTSPYDLSTGIKRTTFSLSTSNMEAPHTVAGHVESSGGTFGETLSDSWIRSNGYVFREQQNRLILTPSDARLESRLQLRAERESSERFNLVGHLLPALQVDHGVPWTASSPPDFVVESHTLKFSPANAMSTIACRRYYAL